MNYLDWDRTGSCFFLQQKEGKYSSRIVTIILAVRYSCAGMNVTYSSNLDNLNGPAWAQHEFHSL